jgi:hypothetical protein
VEPAFEIKEGQIERKKKLGGQLKKKKLRIKFYFIFYFYEFFILFLEKTLSLGGAWLPQGSRWLPPLREPTFLYGN